MIRSVDGHNQALLRQQALAARGSREVSSSSRGGSERDEPSSSSRRPGTGASGKGMRGWDDDDRLAQSSSRWDDGEGTSSGKEKARERDRDGRRDEGRSSTSRRRDERERGDRHRDDRDSHRATSSSHRSRRDRSDREDDSEDEDRRRRRRRRQEEEQRDQSSSSRGRREDDSDRRDSRSSRRSRSPTASRKDSPDAPLATSDDLKGSSNPHMDSSTVADVALSHPLRTSHTVASSPSRSASPEPGPSRPPPSSKMDKYFEESYDPSMDVAPPPKTGLVGDGWERMLEAMKEKEDEKRRAKRVSCLFLRPCYPIGICHTSLGRRLILFTLYCFLAREEACREGRPQSRPEGAKDRERVPLVFGL